VPEPLIVPACQSSYRACRNAVEAGQVKDFLVDAGPWRGPDWPMPARKPGKPVVCTTSAQFPIQGLKNPIQEMKILIQEMNGLNQLLKTLNQAVKALNQALKTLIQDAEILIPPPPKSAGILQINQRYYRIALIRRRSVSAPRRSSPLQYPRTICRQEIDRQTTTE
jgi:hypothetical protein